MKNNYKKLEIFFDIKDINIINYENFFDFFKKIACLWNNKEKEELNLLLKNFWKETYDKDYNFSEKNLNWLDLSWLDLSYSNFNHSSLWWTKLKNLKIPLKLKNMIINKKWLGLLWHKFKNTVFFNRKLIKWKNMIFFN